MKPLVGTRRRRTSGFIRTVGRPKKVFLKKRLNKVKVSNLINKINSFRHFFFKFLYMKYNVEDFYIEKNKDELSK